MPRHRPGIALAGGTPPVLVDSGAWLALGSPRDQHHGEAVTRFRAAVERRVALLTTNLVIAETHRLLLFRLGDGAAAHFLDRIDASERLTLVHASSEHHRGAREWLERLTGHRITYTDAVSFAVMETARCRVAMTFDRHFAIAGFRVWPHSG